MTPGGRCRRAAAVMAAAAAVPTVAAAQWLDFAQADASSETSTLVLVKALPPRPASVPAPLLSATYARWASGEALSVGYMHRWALVDGPRHRWLVGAGVGANAFRSRAGSDEQRESGLSARAQSEWSGPAPGGSYYALAQASSFRGAWFATLQYAPSRLPVAFELSGYREASYRASTAGLRIALGVDHWFVRLGATRTGGKSVPFVGLTYNGF